MRARELLSLVQALSLTYNINISYARRAIRQHLSACNFLRSLSFIIETPNKGFSLFQVIRAMSIFLREYEN